MVNIETFKNGADKLLNTMGRKMAIKYYDYERFTRRY